jgi:hypothetical protein
MLLKAAQDELVALFNLEFVDKLQSFLLNVLLVFVYLGKFLVAFEEDLNSFDANGNELLPGDFAVRVFISEGQKDINVALTQVVLV